MKKLKRVIVALVAVLAIAMPASAQFRFGIKGGMNINKFELTSNVAQNVSTDNRTGWQAGIMTEFTVPIIGIGMDASLLYVHHAKELSLSDKSLDYVELPVNLKYKLALPLISKIIIPFVTTGPSFALNCSGENNLSAQNIKERKFNVAWNAAAGAELFKFLQIGVGYSWGMNKVYEMVDTNSQTHDFGKLNGWVVSAAILF